MEGFVEGRENFSYNVKNNQLDNSAPEINILPVPDTMLATDMNFNLELEQREIEILKKFIKILIILLWFTGDNWPMTAIWTT